MNCKNCNQSQIGQMLFIQGYCWDCLIMAQRSSNLPIETIVGMIQEGVGIK